MFMKSLHVQDNQGARDSNNFLKKKMKLYITLQIGRWVMHKIIMNQIVMSATRVLQMKCQSSSVDKILLPS